MLRSCRNTAKHPDTVRDTRDHVVTSLSMRIPTPWTVANGCTWFSENRRHTVEGKMVSSRSIKSAVYKMNSIGNRTTTLWHSEPDDFWCRPSGTVSDALHPARQEGLESVQRSNTNNEGDLEPCLQIVVDGIKNCGQVDQRIDRQVTVIDCIHCVSKKHPRCF